MVVPTFAKMFKDMDAQLPAITQFVVDASDWIVKYGPYVVVGLIAAFFGFKQFHKTEAGRLYVGGLLMVLPTVGELDDRHGDVPVRVEHRAAAQERRADDGDDEHHHGHLPATTRSTMRLWNGPAAGSRRASRCTSALEETGLFLPMVTNMVQVGEESGQLAQVMEQIAPFYKEKMESMILKVTKMLEPLIIMGMGATIAGLMLAIYMPMFDMAGAVK